MSQRTLPPEFTRDVRLFGGMLTTFVLVVFLAGIDVLMDLRDGAARDHVLIEVVVLGVGLCGAFLMSQRLRNVLAAARALEAEKLELAAVLRKTEEEAARFRKDAQGLVRGLAVAINDQFVRWELSPAEKEVALLLLKGLSHKEIAALRDVSEATARQQARAVYKKGGLGGRNDLAAFFLEDLMLPPESTPAARNPSA
jgi:DNA-binding CsgD family transcriptional regulator